MSGEEKKWGSGQHDLETVPKTWLFESEERVATMSSHCKKLHTFVSVSVFLSFWCGPTHCREQNFLPTENANLEVLKELGVDLQNEGKRDP